MKKYLILLASVIGVIFLIISITMHTQNKAIFLDKNVEKTMSDVRTQEKRRFDLIPNLVECVKAYDEHEYKTLRDVIEARRSSDADIDEIKVMIQAVAEAYPDLKSQKNYQDLMNELANTENKISQYRELYNKEVMRYQLYVEQFPSKQILGFVGYEFKQYKMLEFKNSSEDAPNIGNIFNK